MAFMEKVNAQNKGDSGNLHKSILGAPKNDVVSCFMAC